MTETKVTELTRTSLGAIVGVALRGAAKALTILGALVLAFSAFQLWGTGILEHQAQGQLAEEFAQAVQQGEASSLTTQPTSPKALASQLVPQLLSAGTTRVDGSELATPVPGTAVARIQAPSIGLDKTVVEGVGRSQLRDGPGHYPNTPLPGHVGNVAVAGHRTTHGAPFADLDRLQPGDEIVVETVEGHFTYRVTAQRLPDGTVAGFRIVSPDAIEVIGDQGDNRLTLTSCHPRYSDRQRLVITASLQGMPIADPVIAALAGSGQASYSDVQVESANVVDPTESISRADTVGVVIAGDESLGWQSGQLDEVLLWAMVSSVSASLVLFLGRRVRRWLALVGSLVVLAFPLFQCFVYMDRLLPAY